MDEEITGTAGLNHPLMDFGIEVDARNTLRIETVPRRARFSLRIDNAHLPHAEIAFGASLPLSIGETRRHDAKTALRLGPDELVLWAPQGEHEKIERRFAALYETAPHSLVDVGHADIGLEISGTAAAQVLNAGCPLDLVRLPVGRGTRTVFDRAEIIVLKIDETRFQIVVWRSFAAFVADMLGAAAREVENEPLPGPAL